MSSSPPPTTAVSSPPHNGHIEGESDKIPTMSSEPNPTNVPPSDHSVNGDGPHRGDKQIKVLPNKVYIGGLPEQTRREDLQACFGKIGTIVSIELKLGYGFVEFDSRDAAEESVAKYHEGYFMGNKIRVELSHGGGRTAKYVGEPGACFKCGHHGHWARECPNLPLPGYRSKYDEGRYQDRKEYSGHQPASYPREYPAYPAAPPPRDYRGPSSTTRESRDPYASQPPRGARDEEYRRIAPAPYRDDRAAYYAHYENAPPPREAYPPRPYGNAPERGRPPYPTYPPSGPPVRRDEYDRVSTRDYPPPPSEYRSSHPSYRRRSTSPGHRYPDQRYSSGYGGYSSSYPGQSIPSSSGRSGPPPGSRRETSGY
ncbi:RNA recognition motif protein [Ceratobasidium sp. AG-Ba]|nr:RNA recognition motif protein [Ceratobasidium sp. AG-Ba]